jgi:threonine aldolase
MIYFNCDYNEGAHPEILKLINDTNLMQLPGYGFDEYSENARKYIKAACGKENIDIYFMVGGTQTNMTVISYILRPYEGAIAAVTGHINVHEAGAIEGTGHKVISLECKADGKLTAEAIEKYCSEFYSDPVHEHMVQPGLVYISDSTENGAVYTRSELLALREVTRKYSLKLYMDGARLGYALSSSKSDLTLSDICELCDAFYIGGTKVGAMFGEAVVICDPSLKGGFMTMMKHCGGLLAKGRLLGIQFYALFKDGLYFRISEHAIKASTKLADAFMSLGVKFLTEPVSNQIFPILPDSVIAELSEKYIFEVWEKIDASHHAVRFCTSWATQESNVDELISDLKKVF